MRTLATWPNSPPSAGLHRALAACEMCFRLQRSSIKARRCVWSTSAGWMRCFRCCPSRGLATASAKYVPGGVRGAHHFRSRMSTRTPTRTPTRTRLGFAERYHESVDLVLTACHVHCFEPRPLSTQPLPLLLPLPLLPLSIPSSSS